MVRLVLVNVLLAGAYAASGILGLWFAKPEHASATIIWPPTGIAIAALLLAGVSAWPGVFAGALITNLVHGSSALTGQSAVAIVGTSFGIAFGNTSEALLAATLLNHFANGRDAFVRSREVLLFAVIVVVSAMVSATIGIGSLWVAGVIEAEYLDDAWTAWLLGDCVGGILVTPPLVLWTDFRFKSMRLSRGVEAALLFTATLGIGYVIFSALIPFAYLSVPLLAWAAFRFGPRETSLAMLLLAPLAVWGTLNRSGPFVRETQYESLLYVQLFLATIALTALCMAALVAERKAALQVFRDTQSLLELRVQQRSQDLSQVVRALGEEVGERRRAEEVLQASEQRLRLMIEHAYDAFIVIDSDGKIVEWNPQAQATFGWSRQEILGQELAETIIPPGYREAHRKGLAHFRATGQGPVLNQRLQLSALHRDGHELPVELTISAIPWQTGHLFAGFVRDISGRLEMEEKLRQTERLAAIGEMVTGLAHESRNVLQRIQACLDLLALKVQDKPEQVELVVDIQKAQDRLHHLYQEVRDYAAPLKTQKQTVDVHALLMETWFELSQVREGRKARIEHIYALPLSSPAKRETGEFAAYTPGNRSLSGEAASVDSRANAANDFTCHVDRLGIGQVFRNIFENSLAAAADPVVIEATWSLTQLHARPALRVALRDNGPGFTPEIRERIFEPFFTTKVKGTGLGMAIAKRIVEANGGQILVGTNDNPGAEIVIVLPRE